MQGERGQLPSGSCWPLRCPALGSGSSRLAEQAQASRSSRCRASHTYLGDEGQGPLELLGHDNALNGEHKLGFVGDACKGKGRRAGLSLVRRLGSVPGHR